MYTCSLFHQIHAFTLYTVHGSAINNERFASETAVYVWASFLQHNQSIHYDALAFVRNTLILHILDIPLLKRVEVKKLFKRC